MWPPPAPYGAPPPAYNPYPAPAAPWGPPAPYGAPAAAPYPYTPGGAPPPAGMQPYYGAPTAPPPAAPAAAAPQPAASALYPTIMGGSSAPQDNKRPETPAAAYAPQAPAAPGVWGQPAATHPPAPHAAPHVPQPVPHSMPPAAAPRRKALIIGCGYPGTSVALKGCINDAQCMVYALKKHFGFTDSDVVLLRDDGREQGPDFRSTRANIMKGIQWLMDPAHLIPGTRLVFHFSGHGSQQRSRTHDEADGMDETICPSDFQRAGQIVDNDLNRLLVQPLPPGVVLHSVIDACHSGTAMDLCFTTDYDRYRRMFVWTGYAMAHKSTRGGTAVQFGACRDSQVAQDTSALSGKAFTGAATFAFIQAIEKYGARQTYGQVLSHMTATLHKATGNSNANAAYASSGGGLLGALLGDMVMSGPSEPQMPVLSCDKPMDLNTALMF